jgi:protein gp37
MVSGHRLAQIGSTREKYEGLTSQAKLGPVWNGKLRFWPAALEDLLKWRTPTLIFMCSMSDIAHEDVPVEWFEQIWRAMVEAQQRRGHIFQVLTKRPANLLRLLDAIGVAAPQPGIWLGVSAGREKYWNERVAFLREFPTEVRWISVEPQLELIEPDLKGIDWIVQGGESKTRGKPVRSFNLDWARLMRDRCREAGVPYFLKQVGRVAFDGDQPFRTKHPKGGDIAEWPPDLRVRLWPQAAPWGPQERRLSRPDAALVALPPLLE